VFREHKATIVDVAVSPDGSLALSGDVSGEVCLWDLRQFRPIHHFVLPSEVRSISMSQRDGLAIVAAAGRTAAGDLRLWNVQTLSEVLRLSLAHSPQRVLLSPGGEWAIVGGTDELWSWQLVNQQARWHVPLPGDRIRQLSLGSDPRIVLCVTQSRLLSLDAESGNMLASHPVPHGVVTAALSADGGCLATAGDDSRIRLWSPSTGEAQATCSPKQPPRSLALSPDGSQLAYAAADHRVRIVRTADGQETNVYELPGLSGRHVQFAAASRLLLVAGEDRCVRAFDVSER
jgi:WD40 repeat protein